MPAGQAVVFFALIALSTLLTRLLPFLLFPDNKKTPAYVSYLGQVLPYTVVGMLVVYCLRHARLLTWPYALPEAISIAAIIFLQIYRKNMLLSIGGGTLIYMLLVQRIFV